MRIQRPPRGAGQKGKARAAEREQRGVGRADPSSEFGKGRRREQQHDDPFEGFHESGPR